MSELAWRSSLACLGVEELREWCWAGNVEDEEGPHLGNSHSSSPSQRPAGWRKSPRQAGSGSQSKNLSKVKGSGALVTVHVGVVGEPAWFRGTGRSLAAGSSLADRSFPAKGPQARARLRQTYFQLALTGWHKLCTGQGGTVCYGV